MTRETKRKLGIVGLKVLSLASSVGIPVAVVLQEFPFWKEPPTGPELSAGGFMVILIVLFGFRKELWPIIKEKLHVNSVGELIFWGVCFAIVLWLEGIAALLPSLRTICIAGLTGAGISLVATATRKNIENREVKTDD